MRKQLAEISARLALCLLITLAAGCASSTNKQPEPPVVQAPPPQFSPQSVIQSGDYAGFLAQNQEILKTCQDPEQCTVALFNVAFVHCYSKSPFYNPSKAMKYLDDLIKGAPGSPWAYQAMVWADLVKKSMKKEVKKTKPREEPKEEAKQTAADETVQQVDATTDSAPAPEFCRPEPEVGRQLLEEEIKLKDETIRKLNRQLERSRQIDIEIEKKERGLF